MEIYEYKGEGYNPFLIAQGWQFAKLNYLKEQGLENINKIDKHLETDEAFLLFDGEAILVTAEEGDNFNYNFFNMEKGIVYNVPKGIWHNIVLFEESQVFIVEKNDTHLNDCIYRLFSQEEKNKFNEQLKKFIKNTRG